MEDEMKEKLKKIANFLNREIGESEEGVKINFIVPVLECFGHNRLDFEYMYKDIIIKKELPRFCKVIVETKNYDKQLDKELEQLGRYCREEDPLLGIIANGDEIRIFSPSWRFRSPFQHTLIYRIKRKNLDNDDIIKLLEKIILKDNLKNGTAKDYIIEREKEIEETESEIESIKEEFKKEEEELKVKIEELKRMIKDIDMQIRNLTNQISDVRSKRDKKIEEVREIHNLPVPFIPQIPSVPPEGHKEVLPRGEPLQSGQTIYIELPTSRKANKQPSWKRYNLIPISSDYRSFFPGYEIDFLVETDIGELKMHVTSASEGTQMGDLIAGSYIKGDTLRWIRHHSELNAGNKLKFTVLEPHKKYRIEIV